MKKILLESYISNFIKLKIADIFALINLTLINIKRNYLQDLYKF